MTEITASELKSRLDKGEKLNLFDVREEWEYQEYNIGATNIPLPTLMSRMEDLEDLKDQEVILHCKMGGRAMQAAMILEQAGFKNLVLYRGGTLEWKSLYGDAAK